MPRGRYTDRKEGRERERGREREKGQTKRPKRAFVSAAVAAAGRMIARASLCIIEIDIDTNFFFFCLLCVQCETLTNN